MKSLISACIVLSAALAAALAAPMGALACGGDALKLTHSGTVESMNAEAKTLTIRHAGSERPITFQAEPLMLVGLTPNETWVTVHYQPQGDALRALEIVR